MEKVVDVMSITVNQLLEHLHGVTKYLDFWQKLSEVIFLSSIFPHSIRTYCFILICIYGNQFHFKLGAVKAHILKRTFCVFSISQTSILDSSSAPLIVRAIGSVLDV